VTPSFLRDVIARPTDVLFVGINPSLTSAAEGHHFAGPGNPFWRLLFAAGLVDTPLTYAEDDRLADYGYSLTNLCPRPTRAAAELTRVEIAAGRKLLGQKIRRLGPRTVVFVGVSLYQSYFALPKSGGAGRKPERIGEAAVFVLPNPSGLNASFPGFADKLVWFRALAHLLGKGPAAPGRLWPRPLPRAKVRPNRTQSRAPKK
jgi:TDG/mug DNA glycosylase family protein